MRQLSVTEFLVELGGALLTATGVVVWCAQDEVLARVAPVISIFVTIILVVPLHFLVLIVGHQRRAQRQEREAAPVPDPVEKYFSTAIEVVVRDGHVSKESLQRKLRVSSLVASILMDTLETRGIIDWKDCEARPLALEPAVTETVKLTWLGQLLLRLGDWLSGLLGLIPEEAVGVEEDLWALKSALHAAEASGNTQEAERLLQEIARLEGEEAPEEAEAEESWWEQWWKGRESDIPTFLKEAACRRLMLS